MIATCLETGGGGGKREGRGGREKERRERREGEGQKGVGGGIHKIKTEHVHSTHEAAAYTVVHYTDA